jgi:hypothetical protein
MTYDAIKTFIEAGPGPGRYLLELPGVQEGA